MNRRFLALITLLIMSLAALTGCAGRATRTPDQTGGDETSSGNRSEAVETVYPLTITDFAGREVTIPAEPKRVVSIAPSNTELVFALGKGDVLVGRTDFDDYPPEAQQIDSIGSIDPVNYELIVSKQPDLVLMVGGTVEAREKLAQEYGLPVVVIDAQSFEEVYQAIRLLGQILNCQDQAETLVSEMKEKVDAVAAKAAQAETRPKVFYEVWYDPLMTAGKGTFIDEMIQLAGGENVGAGVDGWATFSLEQLIAADPEIILAGTYSEDAAVVAARPGWEGIQAVKEGRVYPVEDPDLVTIPGPRLVQGLEWIARVIHPELFE